MNMPSAKTADGVKKKKASSKEKEAKEKTTKSSSSKDKKDKKEAKTPKAAPAKDAEPVESKPPTPPVPQDPDAVQLFRRYDSQRTGFLARRDFLRLLRDYAAPPPPRHHHPYGRFPPPRLPLSLTDSRGIPLGYERSEKNSEFEAGQLFERYDKDHAGTLTLDKFLVFFHDFHHQLRAFVDDLSYAPPVSAVAQSDVGAFDSNRLPPEPPSTPPPQETPVQPTPKATRDTYQDMLWELRKICREELSTQRKAILDKMKTLSPRGPEPHRRRHRSPWAENQIADEYEALEHDLERIDEILWLVRRQMRRGWDVPPEEMQAFIVRAPVLLSEARELAMSRYSRLRELESEEGPEDTRAPPSPPAEPAKVVPMEARAPVPSLDELKKTLLVKDQMIYELLQERTLLRREKANAEADLHEVTEVSTQEMKKWAKLTDDMQSEIAYLREELARMDSSDRQSGV